MKFKGIAIGDIHFGIRDTEGLNDSLNDVLSYIETHDLNMVNLDGDYFDRKLMLNDIAGKMALAWFDKLVKLCSDKKISIRIIKGTESHDLSQLDNFLKYEKEADVKVMSYAESEIINGVKILYMPEEYPADKDAYMSNLMKDAPYDLVHGHGTWSFTAFGDQAKQAKSAYHSSPIFYVQDFKDNVKGPIIFGHIHTRISNENKVFYTGSLYRWTFGEETPKGFISYIYDTDTSKYSIEYIDNKKAPDFMTIDAQSLIAAGGALDEIITMMKEISSTGNVRINLDGLDPANLLIIQSSLSGDSNIKLERNIPQFGVNSNENNEVNKYLYIIRRELPIANTIQRYCLEEYGENIDLELIENVINPEKN